MANFFTPRHNPFGKTLAQVALIDQGGVQKIGLSSKKALAKRLLGWAERLKKYS